MEVFERLASGAEALGIVTRLAQRARLDDPTGGSWEAADFQWWWRRRRASDEIAQLFWVDGAGAPEAAVVFTDWGRGWGCDPIVIPSQTRETLPFVWNRARERLDELSLRAVEIAVRDDDEHLHRLVTTGGFEPSDQEGVTTWMPAAEIPPVSPLAAGFRLHDRLEAPDRPHHMIARNGDEVAERLLQTSLYRPDLDLWIESPDGEAASYGIFWLDRTTGVGLVEPMRTEEPYQGMGLARHVLTAGLDRLASLGATRLKVSYEVGNAASERLYITTGFRRSSVTRTFRWRRR